MIDEERSEADREHGGREEQEQDVELGLSVWQAILRRNRDVNTAAPPKSIKKRDQYDLRLSGCNLLDAK